MQNTGFWVHDQSLSAGNNVRNICWSKRYKYPYFETQVKRRAANATWHCQKSTYLQNSQLLWPIVQWRVLLRGGSSRCQHRWHGPFRGATCHCLKISKAGLSKDAITKNINLSQAKRVRALFYTMPSLRPPPTPAPAISDWALLFGRFW
jgi:hypothetical protein